MLSRLSVRSFLPVRAGGRMPGGQCCIDSMYWFTHAARVEWNDRSQFSDERNTLFRLRGVSIDRWNSICCFGLSVVVSAHTRHGCYIVETWNIVHMHVYFLLELNGRRCIQLRTKNVTSHLRPGVWINWNEKWEYYAVTSAYRHVGVHSMKPP